LRVSPGDGADWLLAMLPGARTQARRDRPAVLIAESGGCARKKATVMLQDCYLKAGSCCLGV